MPVRYRFGQREGPQTSNKKNVTDLHLADIKRAL